MQSNIPLRAKFLEIFGVATFRDSCGSEVRDLQRGGAEGYSRTAPKATKFSLRTYTSLFFGSGFRTCVFCRTLTINAVEGGNADKCQTL
jgi:hypothetical protein